MRKVKILTLVILCILTAGLCGVLAYGMTGHNIYVRYGGGDGKSYSSPQLVLEKEIALDGIDSISVQYDMNNNDIYLYESEEDFLTIREYSELELKEDELSTVTVAGSRLEIKGKKRNGRSYDVRIGLFGIRSAYGYVEIGMPSSYVGQLALYTSSGEIESRMDIALEKEFCASASSGDITFPNITAEKVSLSCSSGDIQVDAINAEGNDVTGAVSIATSSGNIDVNELSGEMDIESTSGEITVKQLAGRTNIRSSSGNIDSDTILGNAQIATTSGDITVQCIEGDVTADATSGGIKIYEGSGERMVHTTSGEIQLEGVDSAWDVQSSSGDVRIEAQEGSGGINTTSGDVTLELGKLAGTLRIDCSSGGVRIRLSPDNAFDFKADTSSGSINTFFDEDLSFSKKGNSVQGTYGDNKNGNSIVIGTTSGDVQVEE